jgi:hypothetical protein
VLFLAVSSCDMKTILPNKTFRKVFMSNDNNSLL